jgi:hypothetical protein
LLFYNKGVIEQTSMGFHEAMLTFGRFSKATPTRFHVDRFMSSA